MNPELSLIRAMLNQCVDESLWNTPNRQMGINYESIRQAREDIESEWFYYHYRLVWGEDPQGLISLLQKIWREIEAEPKMSKHYRTEFNKGNGGSFERRKLG